MPPFNIMNISIVWWQANFGNVKMLSRPAFQWFKPASGLKGLKKADDTFALFLIFIV